MDGYTTCPTDLTGDTCSLSVTEFLLYPIIGFILWQAIYFLWVSKLYVNTKFCMKNCLMHHIVEQLSKKNHSLCDRSTELGTTFAYFILDMVPLNHIMLNKPYNQ